MCGKYVKPRLRKPLKTIPEPIEAAVASARNWLDDYTEWAYRHLDQSANNYRAALTDYLRSEWKQELHERLLYEWYDTLFGHIPEMRNLGRELKRAMREALREIQGHELFQGQLRKIVESAREIIGRAIGAV